MGDVKRREAADRIAAKYYPDHSEVGTPDIGEWLSSPTIYEHMNIALDIAVDRDALEARLEALESSLKDPVVVHANILRGTIALTKAQAIHIAGLRADIEVRYREALEVLRLMVDGLVFTPIMRDTELPRKLDYALGWKANDELAERLARNALTMARAILKEKP